MCVLRLYVAGGSPRSVWAIRNVTKLCEEHLAGRVDLAIIDIFQDPAQAAQAQLVAAPTLVRELPSPVRRFIGSMADTGVLLSGLGIAPAAGEPGEGGSA